MLDVLWSTKTHTSLDPQLISIPSHGKMHQVRPELPTARGGLAMAVPSGSGLVLAIGGRRTNGEKLDVMEWSLAKEGDDLKYLCD